MSRIVIKLTINLKKYDSNTTRDINTHPKYSSPSLYTIERKKKKSVGKSGALRGRK